MTVYNKLKIAILTIISSQHLYAITLDPLQIQSAPGELLYAEMSFHQADPNSKLEVGLATPEDLLMIGASHQPPANLNFFTRRNSQGEGAIVITSSRPMTDAELNIILKIKEDGAAHLKHIRQSMRRNSPAVVAKTSAEKSLAPKFIVSEKDIALNLPESTRFNPSEAASKTPVLKQENLLNAPFVLPPVLNTAASKPQPITTTTASSVSTTVPTNKVQPTVTTQTSSASVASTPTPAPIVETASNQLSPVQPSIPQPSAIQNEAIVPKAPEITAKTPENELKNTETKEIKPIEQKQPNKTPLQAKKKIAVKKAAESAPDNAQKHLVKRNESLWSIAQQISNQTNQPITQVMKQIKAQNAHAFINGNANRIRQGSQLNFNLNSIQARPTQNTNQLAAQTTPKAPSGKAKYRLQQAEMSLVAESNQDSSTGSAKKETLQQKISADFSLKVMTAREKTVTLQRNVSQLEVALHQKEQRIQLLNARLAELQEQLKARQETKKSTH